jgi:hypothetical protein
MKYSDKIPFVARINSLPLIIAMMETVLYSISTTPHEM